jgi:hypothetical protein
MKTLDAAFSYGFDNVSAPFVWGTNSEVQVQSLVQALDPELDPEEVSAAVLSRSTHSHAGAPLLRWGYLVAIDTDEPFPVTVHDIDPHAEDTAQFVAFDFWARGWDSGGAGTADAPSDTDTADAPSDTADAPSNGLVIVDRTHPLYLPACPASAQAKVLNSTYWIFAPVLANGWCYLGETEKIVTASAHRVRSITVLNQASVRVELLGAVGEAISSTFVSVSKVREGGAGGISKAISITCKVPQRCAKRDGRASNADGGGECTVYATCTRGVGCTCTPK